jgi:stage III sporulation protein AH
MSFKYNKKHLFLVGLVVLVVLTGYLQYAYRKDSADASGKMSDQDAVFVNQDGIISDTDLENLPGTGAFFVQARLDRETARARNMEELTKIRDDGTVSAEVRDKAYLKMLSMVDETEKELKIESLLKERGYNDSIVIFGGLDSVDVIVRTPTLTEAQATQIADIVSRQGNVEMTSIHIRSMK